MPILAFVANKHNLNSIAALTGALEIDARTKIREKARVSGPMAGKESAVGALGLPPPEAFSLEEAPAAGRGSSLSLRFLWQDERLLSRLRALGRETERLIVALSFATANLLEVTALLGNLRELEPLPFVIAGGPHPSARAEEVLRLGVDAVVIGEGEEVLPALLERLLAGESPAGLPGVATLAADGGLLQGPRPRPVDLDAYPPLGVEHRRFGPIEITRGCPCACAFCQTSFLFGGRMRHRSVENVVAWVRRAMEKGYRYARFVTPNAFAYQSEDNGRTVNLDAIERLLREMAALLGKERVYFGSFPSEVGPETVTPEAVALVRRYCANDSLIVGAQTGSDRLLRALHRNHTVADAYRAAEVIAAGGLRPVVDLIFGLPGEQAKDVAATLKLMEDLVDLGAMLHTHTFMPLPGTPLEDAPPGKVDPALHPLLDLLASQGHQIGQWRKQEEIARRTSAGAA